MYHAVLSRSHQDAACNMLYRTALEIISVMFIQIKQVGSGCNMTFQPVLRAERIRIVLPVMVQCLRKMGKTPRMKYDL